MSVVFHQAAVMFLDSISTFTAVELYDYKQFVFYMVVSATIALDRKVRDYGVWFMVHSLGSRLQGLGTRC